MNEFNTIISKLVYVNVKMDDVNKTINLLCSHSNIWDHLVMTMGNTRSGTLNVDDVVIVLLGEDLRHKSSLQPFTNEALAMRGRS